MSLQKELTISTEVILLLKDTIPGKLHRLSTVFVYWPLDMPGCFWHTCAMLASLLPNHPTVTCCSIARHAKKDHSRRMFVCFGDECNQLSQRSNTNWDNTINQNQMRKITKEWDVEKLNDTSERRRFSNFHKNVFEIWNIDANVILLFKCNNAMPT